jgi:UDP-3-O-[3-hydroxymyristoyl] glucosamine N-acyltransferase
MPDTRFYRNNGPFSLDFLAEFLHLPLEQCPDPSLQITDVAPLNGATSTQLACYHNTKYQKDLQRTQAGACIVAKDHLNHAPAHLPVLVSKMPYRDFARLLSLFYKEKKEVTLKLHPTAQVSSNSKVGAGCVIGPYVFIGDGVTIGENTHIGPYTMVDDDCVIGKNCCLEDHVSLTHSILGDNVTIKPGARIGQRGFGFDMDAQGHIPVPQLGRVIIGDNVDIGANTTIDRGSNADTEIHAGARIDNQVQIAHNVIIGEHSVLVAQVGIAGSTCLGQFVIAAGQVGIAGHLKIGDGARLAAKSGIMRNIEAGGTVGGSPAFEIKEHFKQVATLAKLAKTKGK